MNKKEIYKQGVSNASNTYQRKFNQLSETMRDSIEKQNNINERNYRLQNQMIDNEQRMDEDIDKLFETLGMQRIPGTSGSAVVTPNSRQTITRYTNGILNKYNSFSNLESVYVEPQIVDAIASFLTVSVERDMNKKFHKKLSILEQNGIISQEKFELHRQSVVRAKQLTGLGVYATFSLAPIVCAGISNYLQKKDIVDFVVGVYAYINQELSQIISDDIEQLLLEMNINVNDEKIKMIFEKYCNNSGISHLPIFSKRNREVFGDEGMEILAKEIVSRCDLHDVDVKERALDFINAFLNIDYANAEKIIADAQISQNTVSDITWFSAINYRYIFLDFIQNIENSKRFVEYDINNDPYRLLREERRDTMEKVIHEVSGKKSLFLTAGKRKDIIEASAKMMQCSLNPSYDISMDIKMLKREKEVLDFYGI